MYFDEIITEVFENKEEIKLEEGVFKVSPVIAALALKQKIVSSANEKKDKVVDSARKIKSSALIGKEKITSKVGATSSGGEDATIYKLSKEQKKVVAKIYSKYGSELVVEINKFRINVLAPYQLLKRMVKYNMSVTSKDVAGMTKEQYKKYRASGLKKIQSMGDGYFEKNDKIIEKISNHKERINDLKNAIDGFDSASRSSISPKMLEKIYKDYGVSSGEFGDKYDVDTTREMSLKIDKNFKNIDYLMSKTRRSDKDSELIRKMTVNNSMLMRGAPSKKGSDGRKFKTDYKAFQISMRKFFKRENIKKYLFSNESNEFKKMYLDILKEAVEREENYIEKLKSKFYKKKDHIKLNPLEKKIWKRKIGASEFSDDLKDYREVIKEKHFLDKPIYLKKDDKVEEAQKEIENEIRRFERKLEKIMSPEDYKELKQYRLINRLVTVKDMKNPKELFKSSEEIKKDVNGDK